MTIKSPSSRVNRPSAWFQSLTLSAFVPILTPLLTLCSGNHPCSGLWSSRPVSCKLLCHSACSLQVFFPSRLRFPEAGSPPHCTRGSPLMWPPDGTHVLLLLHHSPSTSIKTSSIESQLIQDSERPSDVARSQGPRLTPWRFSLLAHGCDLQTSLQHLWWFLHPCHASLHNSGFLIPLPRFSPLTIYSHGYTSSYLRLQDSTLASTSCLSNISLWFPDSNNPLNNHTIQHIIHWSYHFLTHSHHPPVLTSSLTHLHWMDDDDIHCSACSINCLDCLSLIHSPAKSWILSLLCTELSAECGWKEVHSLVWLQSMTLSLKWVFSASWQCDISIPSSPHSIRSLSPLLLLEVRPSLRQWSLLLSPTQGALSSKPPLDLLHHLHPLHLSSWKGSVAVLLSVMSPASRTTPVTS